MTALKIITGLSQGFQKAEALVLTLPLTTLFPQESADIRRRAFAQ